MRLRRSCPLDGWSVGPLNGPSVTRFFFKMPKMSSNLLENHQDCPTLTLLNVLGVLGVVNVLEICT